MYEVDGKQRSRVRGFMDWLGDPAHNLKEIMCRSELARDGGGSVNSDVE